MNLPWRAAGDTHVGRVRRSNEDTFRVDEPRGVFVVADGMGGHAAGEVASALAADAAAAALANAVDRGGGIEEIERSLLRSVASAHEAITAHAVNDPSTAGMGTTLTALVILPDGAYCAGHIGDSRLYLLRGDALTQVTTDHTWVQQEVDAGRLTLRGARRHALSHILTRALGAGPPEAPDLMRGTLLAGDRLLLATDGLTGMLPDRVVGAFLVEPRPPEAVVRMLIAAANRRGGRDNVTAVVVDYTG